MSAIPSNLARVPNILGLAISRGAISRTQVDILRVQQQIATGQDIARPSDDIVRASLISILDQRLARSEQISRNLSHAEAALGVLDSIFAEGHALALQARSIASEQVNATSGAGERAAQAVVVDQLLQSLFNIANRESVAGYALGGSAPSSRPIVSHLGAYRTMADMGGLTTDLDLAQTLPITFGAGNPIAGISRAVSSPVDLDPVLTPDTRIGDLSGARGGGVLLGPVLMTFDAGPSVQVDFTGADTVADVLARITSAIRQYETDQGVTILASGGVSTSGGSITIDVVSGGSLRFSDIGSASTARDLGLTADTPFTFTSTSPTGGDLNPRLTWRTPISALAGLGGPLGTIWISNGGRRAEVNLAGAATLGDVRNLIEAAGLGVRVAINSHGRALEIRSDLAAGSAGALAVGEVAGGNLTATRLGIRTLTTDTRIADFNFGRGVSIVDGVIDPQTNTPTLALNADFRIVLGNGSGTKIDIDLRPPDMATLQSLLDRINSEAALQLSTAGLPTTALVASLDEETNAIVLTQDSSFSAPLTIESLNNSPAAEQLGLLGGTYDAGRASLIAQDRATVRVDSLFSDLIDLRDALRANDTRGIALAGVNIERSLAALADVRGLAGAYARTVEQAQVRQSDRITSDQAARSLLADTDIAKAASRLALLQVQLEGALRLSAGAGRLSLLDFLG
jgi:flagellin-like hook-associated protein FlgL